jgi:UDP-2-acetamido-2-deoxy-ribo-hexuluronate aminotransferase
LLAVFEVFPEDVTKRQEIGNRYSSVLSEASGLQTPTIAEEHISVYAQYTILSEHRENIQQQLKEQAIPSVSYYSVPLHLQPVFSCLRYGKGDFPVSESIADQCLSIPMCPYLESGEQEIVVEVLKMNAL